MEATCATTHRRASAASGASFARDAPASQSACGGLRATRECASTCRTTSSPSGPGDPSWRCERPSRASVPGIVHDSSGSGQTLFVEPFAVVEDSNRLREAESAEREEVARILRELSHEVGSARRLARRPRRSGRRDRPRARFRQPLASVAGRACGESPQGRPARRPTPAPRPRGRCPDRPRARRLARGRDLRPEHRRQDRRPEDARPCRSAPPVRAATARRRGRAPRSSTRCSQTSATSNRSR